MRDDLHHCLPQTHRWRRVVQVACAPGLGGDLNGELARAVWEPVSQLLRSEWGQSFTHVLTTAQEDLFGAGSESVQAKLSALEDYSPSPLARRMAEVALAEVNLNGLGPKLLERTREATLEMAAQDGIEGVVAWVADQRGPVQARPLRAALTQSLRECSFKEEPTATKRRAPKPSVDEGLAIVLDVNVD